MARAGYIALVEALVRADGCAVADGQRDDALALAVERYSADRPPGGGGTHTLADDGTSIPAPDREAVCAWAAALLLDQLAALHANDTDSTLRADAVDRQSLSDRYARLARGHRKRYRELLGLDARPERRVRPASAEGVMTRRRAALTH